MIGRECLPNNTKDEESGYDNASNNPSEEDSMEWLVGHLYPDSPLEERGQDLRA